MNVCHLHLRAESEAACFRDIMRQKTCSLKKHAVNINIFASVARSQYSRYCHSLGAALLEGGPYINIYFVRSRTEHEINNSHSAFLVHLEALASLVLS